MTEAEWNDCTDPQRLLEFLRGKVSDRKLRLFACACVRRIHRHLGVAKSPVLIEVAEQYADGEADESEVRRASEHETSQRGRVVVSGWVAVPDALSAASEAARYCQQAAGHATRVSLRQEAAKNTRREHATVLRCLFNPFHASAVDPAWNSGAVVRLAQAIYEERAFDRMPILADALEDSGCTNQDFLAHCRGSGPHARGCWVVDLLLAKE